MHRVTCDRTPYAVLEEEEYSGLLNETADLRAELAAWRDIAGIETPEATKESLEAERAYAAEALRQAEIEAAKLRVQLQRVRQGADRLFRLSQLQSRYHDILVDQLELKQEELEIVEETAALHQEVTQG